MRMLYNNDIIHYSVLSLYTEPSETLISSRPLQAWTEGEGRSAGVLRQTFDLHIIFTYSSLYCIN